MRAWSLALLVAAAAVLAVPAGSAQIRQCGDIQLVFRNPDLQPGEDGIIEASGQFFAQFQAIGEGADAITTFGFSFGPDTVAFEESACDTDPWVTGTYVPNYRADRDPTDGFFIPLQTSLVPDGSYAAAVHAYDASNNELARLWVRAVVDNCDAATNPPRCDGDAAQVQRQDKVAPWPMVLPGDGAAREGHAMTLEFAEQVGNLTVYLNGEDVTASLVDIDPRVWDADTTPDYGPGGTAELVAPPCSQPAPVHQCEVYGPAYALDLRPLTNDDVVRVEATDLSGNLAVKTIHVGSSVAGGAITDAAPILGYEVDRLDAVAEAGGLATFSFLITNTGGGTGHPFATAEGPTGWNLTWDPDHAPVPPGETVAQDLNVGIPPGTPEGTYAINATLSYESEGRTKVLSQPVKVHVGDVPDPGATPATTEEPEGDAKKGSPGLGLAAALAAVALALASRGRRGGAAPSAPL